MIRINKEYRKSFYLYYENILLSKEKYFVHNFVINLLMTIYVGKIYLPLI